MVNNHRRGYPALFLAHAAQWVSTQKGKPRFVPSAVVDTGFFQCSYLCAMIAET